ncbi:MAG: NAD(P)-binding domain-containing protein [Gammaproteobacteria bacterium]
MSKEEWKMSDLTLIGLGAMGSAIARTLADKGCRLTLWNRSPVKAEAMSGPGVEWCASLRQAIAASPRIQVCIHGYAATRALFDDPEILPLLDGRSVIQMSTGTPADAREAQEWFNQRGARYLDCSIMVYPQSVGEPEGQLLISGERETWDDCATYINHLGGDIRYLGPVIGAAAAIDLAVVTRLVVNTVGIVYGLHLCESEQVPFAQFASMYPDGDRARHLAAVVESGRYDETVVASVGTGIEVVSAIRNFAAGLGINSELPDFILDLYRRAEAAGYLEHDNACLIEVFRDNARAPGPAPRNL